MESEGGAEPAECRRGSGHPSSAGSSGNGGETAPYLEAVVRELAAAIVVTDLDRRIRVWSSGAERLLGYCSAEIAGEPYTRLVPEDLLESDATELRRVLESEQALSFPTQYLARNGRRIPVEVFRSVVRDRNGNPLGYSSVILDQTEKLAMQDRLLQAERLNALGRVVGKVFHELRTPLGVLVLQAEILSEEIDELLDHAGDYVDAIVARRVRESLVVFTREIQRIEGLAEDYLLMIRPIKAHPSSLRLGDFMETLESELRGKSERPGYEVKIDCRRPDAVVRFDPLQMLRVFHNLAGNSLDAIPEERSPLLMIHADVEEDQLVLSLRDNGPGLPPDLRGGGAFEIFATTKRSGSGLGLHLVQEIVLAHGGRITLTDHPRGGVQATIELPIQRTA